MFFDDTDYKLHPPITSTNHTNLVGIHWEISSSCQASCPCCIRKASDGTLAKFTQTYTTKDQVVKILEGIDSIQHVSFCGNIGDPMTNPDIYEISKFLREEKNTSSIKIHTNGGIGNPQRYYELGTLGVRMIFGVDGTAGINELHRGQVDFEKVDRNAREYVRGLLENRKKHRLNSDAVFQIQFILWDQNVHNLPAMIDWINDVGADEIFVRRTYGYGIIPVYGNEGNYLSALTWNNDTKYQHILEKVYHKTEFNKLLKEWNAIEGSNTPIPPVAKDFLKPQSDYVFNKNKIKFPMNAPYSPNEETISKMVELKSKDVNCNAVYYDKGLLQTYIYITYKHMVMPCCYIGSFYSSSIMGEIGSFHSYPESVNATEAEVMNKLFEIGLDKFDALKRPLKDILNDGTLDNLALTSVHTENKLSICARYCAKRGSCNT